MNSFHNGNFISGRVFIVSSRDKSKMNTFHNVNFMSGFSVHRFFSGMFPDEHLSQCKLHVRIHCSQTLSTDSSTCSMVLHLPQTSRPKLDVVQPDISLFNRQFHQPATGSPPARDSPSSAGTSPCMSRPAAVKTCNSLFNREFHQLATGSPLARDSASNAGSSPCPDLHLQGSAALSSADSFPDERLSQCSHRF